MNLQMILFHRKKNSLSFIFLIYFLFYSNSVFAQTSCDTYPYQALENSIEFDGGGNFKLISTGAASVDFDIPAEVMSARREAELIAKRTIAEYINQKLSSEDNISSEISKSSTNSKATNGTTVSSAQRDEVKKQLSTISAKADAVLKGVIPIGSCYTKGHEVRVTVGIKSETVANAKELGKSMGLNKANSYGTGNSSPGGNSDNSNSNSNNSGAQPNTKDYSGDKQINKF